MACRRPRTDQWLGNVICIGQVEQLKAFAIRANLEREECLEKERALARERVDETLNVKVNAVPGACREGSRANASLFFNQVKCQDLFICMLSRTSRFVAACPRPKPSEKRLLCTESGIFPPSQ